ncbi:hypothetical protein PFISCL1PPCAC_25165, partial [Pristionchus fissidentatus]
NELLDNSRIICEASAPFAENLALTSAGTAIIGILIAIFACILAFGGCFGMYLLFSSRGKLMVQQCTVKKWKRMSAKDRIETATSIFRKASCSSPDSHIKIIHGFELLDVMLATYTDEPDAWEPAFFFLSRCHGASTFFANRLTGRFSRYLYIQAKRIIDKKGWKTSKRITKKHYKGYIRSVAIRLLAYCKFNKETAEEVDTLILDGFDKLRFNTVGQYPHCGQLWSLVAQIQHKKSAPKLIKRLAAIAKVPKELAIPEDETFACIGNV